MNVETTLKFLELISEIAILAKKELNEINHQYNDIVEKSASEIYDLNKRISLLELRIHQIEKAAYACPDLQIVTSTSIEEENTPLQPAPAVKITKRGRPAANANHVNKSPGICMYCNEPTPPGHMFCSVSHQVKYGHRQRKIKAENQPAPVQPIQEVIPENNKEASEETTSNDPSLETKK